MHRLALLALALSLVLHGLLFKAMLSRAQLDPAQTPPLAVALIVEPENAPSGPVTSAPAPYPPLRARATSRRQPHHRASLPSAPVESAPSPIAIDPALAPATGGTPDVAAPAPGASAGAAHRVFAEDEVDSAAQPAARIQPRYPEQARLMGRESDVKLRVTVEADGRVSHVELLSSGGEEFDREAEDALERARFVAARRGDEPVAAIVRFTVRFRLDE